MGRIYYDLQHFLVVTTLIVDKVWKNIFTQIYTRSSVNLWRLRETCYNKFVHNESFVIILPDRSVDAMQYIFPYTEESTNVISI